MSSNVSSIDPWANSDSGRFEITENARSFVGRTLAAVRYLAPKNADRESSGPMHFDGFDWVSVVGIGVELEMTDGETLSIAWRIGGERSELSGLSVGASSARDRSDEVELVGFPVESTEEWRVRVGHRITDVSLGWVGLDNEGLKAVCSVQIEFHDAPTVTFVSAGVEDFERPAITLSPDDISVIFEASVLSDFEAQVDRVTKTQRGEI